MDSIWMGEVEMIPMLHVLGQLSLVAKSCWETSVLEKKKRSIDQNRAEDAQGNKLLKFTSLVSAFHVNVVRTIALLFNWNFNLLSPKSLGSYSRESFALATSIALQIYYEAPDKWQELV